MTTDPTYIHLSRNRIGRLALDRYDFKQHVDGTGFNQEAQTVLLIPGLDVDGYTADNVRSALESIIDELGSAGAAPGAPNESMQYRISANTFGGAGEFLYKGSGQIHLEEAEGFFTIGDIWNVGYPAYGVIRARPLEEGSVELIHSTMRGSETEINVLRVTDDGTITIGDVNASRIEIKAFSITADTQGGDISLSVDGDMTISSDGRFNIVVMSAPTGNPSDGIWLWIDSTTHNLKYQRPDGTIEELVSPLTQPGGSMSKTTPQSIPAGTTANITFNTEDEDTGDCINIGVHPTRFTAPKTGAYIITGQVDWDSSGDGTARILRIRKNGGDLSYDIRSQLDVLAGVAISQSWSRRVRLTAGDYIELGAGQDGASPHDVLAVLTGTFVGA